MWTSATIASIYGSDVRRIQQLNAAGVIKGEGRPAMYEPVTTLKALFEYQRKIIQGKEKNAATEELERRKLAAEAEIKESKAKIAKMEHDELEGKLHRAEDVEAITTDHVLFFRSMLMALPGKLAVDLAGDHTAAEQAETVKKEVSNVLERLANYRYDPEEYKKRVKERRGWDNPDGDDPDG